MSANQTIMLAVAVAFAAFVAWVELSRLFYALMALMREYDELLRPDLIFKNPKTEPPSYTKTK